MHSLARLLRCAAPILPALLLALPAPPAAAQATEYRLSDAGEWEAVDAPEPGSDEAIIADARRRLADEDPASAKEILDAWIERNEASDSPWLPEAYLLRGDAILAMDREFDALYDYEAVIRQFPESEAFLEALDRELEIAIRYANGLRIRLLGIRVEDAGELAVELLIRVQERAPRSAAAERAAIELADYYYRTRDMELAQEAYDLYIANYPQGEHLVRALKRRIFANIALFKGPRYDASHLIDAREQIRAFSNAYPAEAEQAGLDDALLARIDESEAAQLLETATWRLGQGDGAGARFLLRRLVRKHPRSLAASRALQILRSRGWLEDDPVVSEAIGDEPAGDGAAPSEEQEAEERGS